MLQGRFCRRPRFNCELGGIRMGWNRVTKLWLKWLCNHGRALLLWAHLNSPHVTRPLVQRFAAGSVSRESSFLPIMESRFGKREKESECRWRSWYLAELTGHDQKKIWSTAFLCGTKPRCLSILQQWSSHYNKIFCLHRQFSPSINVTKRVPRYFWRKPSLWGFAEIRQFF